MQSVNTIIIGSGFAGLCMGIKLRKAGRDDFLILEKANQLGGTWRENIYPGAECDIPSALYSYSFEHNADWEFKWSGQAQILKYQRDTAEKYELQKHFRFAQQVVKASFSDGQWLVATSDGEHYLCQHLVSAVGQLHHPFVPALKGADLFAGSQFHSAEWNADVDFTGLRVAVIGNAASAVQFIPEIANQAAKLVVYQRSPNWILPKVDRAYSGLEKKLSARYPWLTKLYRRYLWTIGEHIVLPAIRGRRWARGFVKFLCMRNLNKHIHDEELKASLVPDYPVGAKRVLFSDSYYPALQRDNVQLNTCGIDQIVKTGIIDKDGQLKDFDLIIYGTGFKTNPFLADIAVTGQEGQSLREHWGQGAFAFYGLNTHGFPNLHILYGPNTNLGHSSIIIMLEAQADHVVRAMQHLEAQNKQSMEVKREVEQGFNQQLQADLGLLAFSQIKQSWYIDHGRVTNNWSGGTREYCRRLANVSFDDFLLS